MQHGDLSVKGIARVHGGIADTTFSVLTDLLQQAPVSYSLSLRERLEAMALTLHIHDRKECIYVWTAAWRQTWTHVLMCVDLVVKPGVSAATLANCLQLWVGGIYNFWNKKWACARPGELACRLDFQFDHSGTLPGVGLIVSPPPLPGSDEPTTVFHWHTSDGASVAAHEFGHMIGDVDEYVSPVCPDRWPVDTKTVMDHQQHNVPARLVRHLAGYIDSDVVSP